MKQIRILLADDHTVMRRGLRLLLESHPQFGVVAEASDGRQAIEQARPEDASNLSKHTVVAAFVGRFRNGSDRFPAGRLGGIGKLG